MLVMGTNVEDNTSQQQLQLEGIVCFYLPPCKSLKALTDLNKDIYIIQSAQQFYLKFEMFVFMGVD